MEQDVAIVAQGALTRLKELSRSLTEVGVEARILAPSDGCLNG